MLWAILIVVLLVCLYIFLTHKSEAIKTIKRVEEYHEVKIKNPEVNISVKVNNEYYKSMAKLHKKILNGKTHDDDTYLLGKIISDPEVNEMNYVLAHELYLDVIDMHQQKVHELPKVVFRDDPQNVHDSVLNAEVDKQLAQLPSSGSYDYVDFLASLGDPKVDLFLINTVGTTYKGKKEQDIYSGIWDKAKKTKEGIDAFVTSIKECVREDGYLHCTTGRVDRVLSSLAGIEGDFGILKNTDVLKQEALEKCAVILDRLNAKLGKEPDDETLKNEITRQLTNDYSHVDPVVLKDIISMCTNI